MQAVRQSRGAVLAAALLCLALPCTGQNTGDVLPQSRALLQSHRPAEAVTLLQQFVAMHPDSAEGTYLLAYAYYAAKQPLPSLELYTRGAALRAPSAEDFMAVSADYILLEDYADASKWLGRVTTMQPENALAWYYLGRSLHLTARYAEAVTAFGNALKLQPRYVRAEVGLGLSREAQGDNAAALAAYQQAILWQTEMPQQDAQPYLSAGELLLREDQNAGALQHLQLAEKYSHGNPRVLEDLGKALERLGRLAEAEAVLGEAEHLAPSSSSVHFLLGTAYQREGRKDDAAREFALTNGLLRTESNRATENFDLGP